MRIADPIAIRSIVLGNNIPSIGGSKAGSARGSVVSPTGSNGGRVVSPSGSQQRVVSPTGSNGSGVRSPKFASVSENEILEEEE